MLHLVRIMSSGPRARPRSIRLCIATGSSPVRCCRDTSLSPSRDGATPSCCWRPTGPCLRGEVLMHSVTILTDPQPGDAGRTCPSDAQIGRYVRVPVEVHEADPRAPEAASCLIALIATKRPGTPAEHVGSSAVTGLAGKNTIDLLLAAEPADIPDITQILLELGFQPQIPAAFPATRPMLWGAFRHGPTEYRVHVHVVPASSPEVAAMLGFRDALRADPCLRRRYAALKRAIVEGGLVDPVTFTRAKHDWIVTALTRLGLASHQPRRLYQDDLGLGRSQRLAA